MSSEAQPRWEDLGRRYDLPSQPEWQKLLTLFDVAEGFSLIVLLVLDADGAALCRRELEKHLQREGKQLVAIELPTPDDLRQLPTLLLAAKPPPNTGCLWMSAVEPDYGKTYPEWREAWREALARLNSHRNPIRRQFDFSLVFVGAPWLQEIMRETASDLWSVRTLVVRIEPAPRPAAERQVPEAGRFELAEERGGGDPVFALREAEKLRGVPGKELALARLLHRAGEGFAGRDDWRAAEKALTEALELKQRAGAPAASVLATLLELAWACQVLGQASRSMSYAQEALRIAREIGDRRGEGAALGSLGNAYAVLGETRKAIEFHEQALVILREIGNRRGEGAALGNLGLAYADLGDARKAIEFYEQHLAISREIGDRRGEANALGNLGNAYFRLGDTRKAIEFYEQQLVIAREIGDRHGEGNALGNLGNAHRHLGDTRKAIEFYEQRLVIAREIGDRRGEGNALGNLGNAYAALGDARKALEFYEQALVIDREIGDRRGEGNDLWNSALALETLGDRAQAIARAEAALRIFEAIEDPNAAMVRARLAEWRKGGA
jgi:tetratricopeptide (TPR) repeat protein